MPRMPSDFSLTLVLNEKTAEKRVKRGPFRLAKTTDKNKSSMRSKCVCVSTFISSIFLGDLSPTPTLLSFLYLFMHPAFLPFPFHFPFSLPGCLSFLTGHYENKKKFFSNYFLHLLSYFCVLCSSFQKETCGTLHVPALQNQI